MPRPNLSVLRQEDLPVVQVFTAELQLVELALLSVAIVAVVVLSIDQLPMLLVVALKIVQEPWQPLTTLVRAV